jgi:60 kDa SS-A/Ro ribonucleoprotein
MANKQLFSSATAGKQPKPARTVNTINNAGGKAYAFTPEHALAQLAATGCLSQTYYVSPEDQLQKVKEFAEQCTSEYIAKCAVYARKSGHMKDMPALLCALLAARCKTLEGEARDEAKKWLECAFPLAIDNDKMLRNFVQIVRSGTTGRKSLGTVPRRLIHQWFDKRNGAALFRASVGESPSLADIIRLAHVKAGEDKQRDSAFKYLLGYPEEAKADEKQKERRKFYKKDELPQLIQDYEKYKAGENLTVPQVPFQMLTALPLSTADWTTIALNGGWQFTRMNLNTFQRHGVLKDKAVVKKIAEKLANAEEIQRARVFPYQLLMAYLATEDNSEIPVDIKMALQAALEIATKNTPSFGDNVWVFPDVSGSMSSPVTGGRGSATTKMRCIDVAALFAACVLRTTPGARVIPVDTSLHTRLQLNPLDSVMTNAKKLAACGGGGTSLQLGLQHILDKKEDAETIIFFSDNESWATLAHNRYNYLTTNKTGPTEMEQLFRKIQTRNANCKLVCLDVTPNTTTQAADDPDILNIGGFNDSVWGVIENFVKGQDAKAWVETIKALPLVMPENAVTETPTEVVENVEA